MTEDIELLVAGRTHRGILARPSKPRRHAGVLVFHGGGGLTEHERVQVEHFAARGFVALAPDLFGEVFADRAHGMRVIGDLMTRPAELRERVNAGLGWLAADRDANPARIVAVGHCFGGLAALDLARSGANVLAVVSLHGRLATALPARPCEVRARVLACTGADDPFCPRDQRVAFEDEMTAAGVDWQHHVYAAALHGFSVPTINPATQPGCAYHERADQRSRAAMAALFDEVLGVSADQSS
jgi:dienelactone hydrolase